MIVAYGKFYLVTTCTWLQLLNTKMALFFLCGPWALGGGGLSSSSERIPISFPPVWTRLGPSGSDISGVLLDACIGSRISGITDIRSLCDNAFSFEGFEGVKMKHHRVKLIDCLWETKPNGSIIEAGTYRSRSSECLLTCSVDNVS